MSRRAEAKNVKDGRLIVTFPSVVEETALGFPSLAQRLAAVLGPLPIDAAMQRLGHRADFGFRPIAIEVAPGRQDAGKQQSRVDER